MLLPFIFIGFIFQFLYGIFINFVIYSEKTHLLSIITVTTLLLSFIISYQFISNFGLIGASYSFMLSNFILFTLVFMLSRKVYYLPWFNIYSIKV
jgi:O-antigen/teichoic acid export membrane protein